MNKKKAFAVITILFVLIQLVLPQANVWAYQVEKLSNDEISLNVELKRDAVQTDQINITATDSKYNITELKYVNKRIETSNISYFEEENNDVITFSILPARTITRSFKMAGYGTYTVYAKNEHGDRFLSRITIHDPGEAPDLTVTQDEEKPFTLHIQVISKNSQIKTLKIAKKASQDETIDFTTQGTNIEFIPSNQVNVEYSKITEAGIYEIYAADEQNNSSRYTLYVSEKTTPITVQIEETGERSLSIHVTDDACDITKIKVASKSEITSFDDFKYKGTNLNFTKSNDIILQYIAAKDDTYVFYFEDEMGYKKMVEKRITTEKPMNITISQDKDNPKQLTIEARNSLCKIEEMKVALGTDIDIEYFKENGEVLNITPSQVVRVNYELNVNATINVYIKDEQGYSYMYKKAITGIEEPEVLPPTIELSQNADKPNQIDVIVRDVDSYIRRIKWAKGNQNVPYFESQGTAIGSDLAGKLIKTNFTIDAVGTYTVYAEDNDGQKTVKTITITSLTEKPDVDTTKPSITGVENNKIYTQAVTPKATDEHLKEVILKKEETIVDGYRNGSSITEEGNYTLTAIDESGNGTTVKFMIDKMAPNMKILQNQPLEGKVTVNVTVSDNLSGVELLKVAVGKQNIEYFANQGQEIPIEGTTTKTGIFLVTENGTYTVYAKDIAGNETVQTIEVTTLNPNPDPNPEPDPEPDPEPEEDKVPPTISLSYIYRRAENKVEVNVQIQDEESQIAQAKIATGNQTLEYFVNQGQELPLKISEKEATTMFYLLENGTYTIYAKDTKNNATIKTIQITQIQENPEPTPGEDTTPPTITGVEQGKTYKTSVKPIVQDENLASVMVYVDGKLMENYQVGNTLTQNGNYVIIAKDEAGNTTTVEFTIDIQSENPNEDNKPNEDDKPQEGTDPGEQPEDPNEGVENGQNNTQKPPQNENIAQGILPQTGENILIWAAIASCSSIAIYGYIQYRKLK